MKLKDFVIKSAASAVIYAVGLFYAAILCLLTFLACFWEGYRNVFNWMERCSSGPPLHYNSWDAESRKSPSSTSKKWNHAYITVPETGLRFHYVYSGTVPSDVSISDIDGETTHSVDNNNIVSNRPKLLICAHGYPECWFSWRYVLRFFDKGHPDIGEYFVVAVDMRGYGDSDRPADYMSYHRNLLCGDIKGIAASLGYRKFSLLGHDWGGAVAWEVAKNYPHSLEKVIVLNGPEIGAMMKSLAVNPVQILKSWYIFFFQISWIPDFFIRLSDFFFLKEIITGGFAGIRNETNKLTEEEVEMVKYGVRHSTTCPVNYYRALAWPFANPGPDLLYDKDCTDGDPLLETPVLIIWGENDSFLSKTIPEIILKRLNPKNGSKLVWIAESSHWVQQDEPEEVVRHLKDFLKL